MADRQAQHRWWLWQADRRLMPGALTGSGALAKIPPVRARDLGILIGSLPPGPHNAITDIPGVRVGHRTISFGEGPLVQGSGPARTGVTTILPSDRVGQALLFAGCHRLNGNGELTGLEWIREAGVLTSPVAITNTHSVGIVRDALVAADVASRRGGEIYWSLPVVGETWDGMLNDINGMHVRPEHVFDALAGADDGPVAEGNVGGGTGMICHELKGGIGTSSRVLPDSYGGCRVGVLVQANHGRRSRLCIAGVPVGENLPISEVPSPYETDGTYRACPGGGSIIVVVATDLPLLPHQCRRLAQRAGLGIARVGGVGEHTSGDLFLAFSTGNSGAELDGPEAIEPMISEVAMLADAAMTPVYDAVVEATEESIVNALLAAETMTGRDGITAHGLPHERLLEILESYGRHPAAS